MSVSEEKNKKELARKVVAKVSQTGKKGAELAVDVLGQAAEGGKVIAGEIAKGVKGSVEKARADRADKKFKKYNPLFWEEYSSSEFYLPNIIRIVDDAVRRDIDVCKGAIGWRESKRDTEVLYLYDEFVNQSGLTFLPVALCNEVYYVDSHDRKCFVKLDYIFQKTHEEKLAELEYIAYSLGAKSCTVHIEEREKKYDKKKRGLEIKGQKQTMSTTESYEVEMENDILVKRSGKSETQFKGNEKVRVPVLKWFIHDKNILNLIEYRCEQQNEITSKTLVLSGYSSATMSRQAASSIDATVAEMGLGQSYSMEDKAVKESESKIIYHLEF